MLRTPNLILVGFMGTGKSTVGRACAATLGFPYHDTDMWIVRRARMPITQIFATEGEEAFREREREAIRHLTQRSAIVLSTGGGAPVDGGNAALLRESGIVILLTATVEAILTRVLRRANRPLLACDDPESRVREMLGHREPVYRDLAQATVDTSDLSSPEVADRVVALYRAMST
jgi:shikimate kinase